MDVICARTSAYVLCGDHIRIFGWWDSIVPIDESSCRHYQLYLQNHYAGLLDINLVSLGKTK